MKLNSYNRCETLFYRQTLNPEHLTRGQLIQKDIEFLNFNQ